MRQPDARWRRVPSALTRHRERSPFRAQGWRALEASNADQMLRRGYVPAAGETPSVGFHSHRLEGMYPFRTPGKIDKPLRLLGLWRANRDQKSPVRRCFKSRPPLGGVRRFASGCRSSKGG